MSSNSESPEDGVEVLSEGNAAVVAGALERNSNEIVQAIEDNPDIWVKIVLDFLPVVGGINKIMEARSKIGGTFDEEAMQNARELCLIGIVEVILDGASLGTTSVLPDEIFTIINRLNMLIKAQGKGEKLGGKWGDLLSKFDVVGKIARLLLKSSKIEAVTDKVLMMGNGRLGEWQKQLPPPQG